MNKPASPAAQRTRMSTKVSIIIPVYNSAAYLPRCLESVTKQSLEQIEIICVDDGSTDSSYEVLKEWAGKERRATQLLPLPVANT